MELYGLRIDTLVNIIVHNNCGRSVRYSTNNLQSYWQFCMFVFTTAFFRLTDKWIRAITRASHEVTAAASRGLAAGQSSGGSASPVWSDSGAHYGRRWRTLVWRAARPARCPQTDLVRIMYRCYVWCMLRNYKALYKMSNSTRRISWCALETMFLIYKLQCRT